MILLLFVGLLATQSRGALIGLMAGTAYLIFRRALPNRSVALAGVMLVVEIAGIAAITVRKLKNRRCRCAIAPPSDTAGKEITTLPRQSPHTIECIVIDSNHGMTTSIRTQGMNSKICLGISDIRIG